MQNQISKKESNSEEIYQEMTRDALGFFFEKKTLVSENLIDTNLLDNAESIAYPKYEQFIQKLLNIFTAEFQSILPGAFQISPQPIECLSYANLHSWSPSRAYFSLFEMKKSKSIWILHLSRSVGEGLAFFLRKQNSNKGINIFSELSEADSLIYLEIGVMIRELFSSVIKIWPKNLDLDFSRCRHILQLGFQKGFHLHEKYYLFPFLVKNKDCSGDLNIIIPLKYLKKITI